MNERTPREVETGGDLVNCTQSREEKRNQNLRAQRYNEGGGPARPVPPLIPHSKLENSEGPLQCCRYELAQLSASCSWGCHSLNYQPPPIHNPLIELGRTILIELDTKLSHNAHM
jgi:hypothetical protein